MHPEVRSVTSTSLIILLVLLAAFTRVSADTSSGDATCMLWFPHEDQSCFSPARVRSAEARVHPRPVNPTSIVARLAQLELTQVATEVAVGLPGRNPIGKPTIVYIYGSLPQVSVSIPDPSPSTPRWMVVIEAPGHIKALKGLLLTQTSFTSGGPSVPTPDPNVHRDWWLDANFVHFKLTLGVASNLGRPTTKQVGLALIRSRTKG